MMEFFIRHRGIVVPIFVAFCVALPIVLPIPETLSHNQDLPLYSSAAQGILRGDFLLEDFGRNAPGWSFYLAALYGFFGESSLTLALSQVALFLIVVSCTYILAQKEFNEMTATTAALTVALWPSLLFQLQHGSSVMLYCATFLLAILFVSKARESKKFRHALVAGALVGFGALTDVVALFIPIVFMVWFLIADDLRSSVDVWGVRLLRAAVFTVGFIGIVIPWTYRNFVVFDDFSIAPIIAKSEQNYFDRDNLRKIEDVIFAPHRALLWESVGRVVLFPAGLHNLDRDARFSYKQEIARLALGTSSARGLSGEEIRVLALKIVITILHIAVIVSAFRGTLLLRKHRIFSSLTLLLSLYIVLAVTATVAVSNGNFDAISLPNGFLIPLMPLVIILAIARYYEGSLSADPRDICLDR